MKRWLIILGFAVTISVALAVIYKKNSPPPAYNNESTTQISPAVTPAVPKPVAISGRYLVAGDVFWGRVVDDWSKASPLKFAYPFSGLSTFDREKYDGWIANLECPVTDRVIDSATQEKYLSFSCPKGYTPEAAKWFTAFSLANNHMDNQDGEWGLRQTRETLEQNGIQYFGHYDNAVKEDTCEVAGIPVTIKLTSGQDTKGEIPIALCGFHHVFKLPKEDEIAIIQQYSKIMPTWVFPHMGVEYQPAPDTIKTNIYHSYVDNGADMVIGGHPHWVQTSEAYKGKLIVYSLGNFIFDQQGAPGQGDYEVRRGMGLDISLAVSSDENIDKWLNLGKSCKKFKDDCLSKAKAMNLEKPQIKYTYSVVASDDSKRLTKKASDEWQKLTLERLRWSETMKALGQNQ